MKTVCWLEWAPKSWSSDVGGGRGVRGGGEAGATGRTCGNNILPRAPSPIILGALPELGLKLHSALLAGNRRPAGVCFHSGLTRRPVFKPDRKRHGPV